MTTTTVEFRKRAFNDTLLMDGVLQIEVSRIRKGKVELKIGISEGVNGPLITKITTISLIEGEKLHLEDIKKAFEITIA